VQDKTIWLKISEACLVEAGSNHSLETFLVASLLGVCIQSKLSFAAMLKSPFPHLINSLKEQYQARFYMHLDNKILVLLNCSLQEKATWGLL
jgi:hypothetical protein